MWVRSLGWEDPLEEEMATHSSILAWEIPWTEESGGLQSTGLQRVGHDWTSEQRNSIMIDMMIMTSEMRSVAFNSVEPSLNWNCPLPYPNSFSLHCSWYPSSRWVVLRDEGSHVGQRKRFWAHSFTPGWHFTSSARMSQRDAQPEGTGGPRCCWSILFVSISSKWPSGPLREGVSLLKHYWPGGILWKLTPVVGGLLCKCLLKCLWSLSC